MGYSSFIAIGDSFTEGVGDELPDGTRLVDAPFVEGAVAAVVTAAAGADLTAVEAAAAEAYSYRKV